MLACRDLPDLFYVCSGRPPPFAHHPWEELTGRSGTKLTKTGHDSITLPMKQNNNNNNIVYYEMNGNIIIYILLYIITLG